MLPHGLHSARYVLAPFHGLDLLLRAAISCGAGIGLEIGIGESWVIVVHGRTFLETDIAVLHAFAWSGGDGYETYGSLHDGVIHIKCCRQSPGLNSVFIYKTISYRDFLVNLA